MKQPPKRQPTFLWQGLLIVLPVAALALAGLFSVAQDRVLAEASAREQARSLADSLAAEFQLAFDFPGSSNRPASPALGSLPSEVDRFLSAARQAPDSTNAFAPQPDEDPLVKCVETPLHDHYLAALVNGRNELVYPPPMRETPLPGCALPPGVSAEQSNLWATARAADFVSRDFAGAIEVYDRLVKSLPAGRFRTLADYEAAVVLKENGQWGEASDRFASLAHTDPEWVGESGLPLNQLALFQLATIPVDRPDLGEAAARGWSMHMPGGRRLFIDGSGWFGEAWNELCPQAVVHPTILSGRILSQAAELSLGHPDRTVAGWLRVWELHQASREMFASLTAAPAGGTLWPERINAALLKEWQEGILKGWQEGGWLVWGIRLDAANYLVLAQTREQVQARTDRLVRQTTLASHLPAAAYFSVAVDLAGQQLSSLPRAAVTLASRDFGLCGLPRPSVLDGANVPAPQEHNLVDPQSVLTARLSSDGGPASPSPPESSDQNTRLGSNPPYHGQLQIYLADGAGFYAQQRQRALIFGALVGLSALAAFVGFLAAQRAFHRQLALGEMKSNFVSSVSHELRAPIASVRLMAEGLERGTIREPQKQMEYFRFIVQECRRLSSLIENVLDFSRIEQGRKEYEFDPTDVVELATQTVKIMQTYAEDRQITIALEFAGSPLPADLDGKAIQQALVNLLDNAIKHSPRGAAIAVRVRFVPPPAATLEISVEDHGEGIPPGEHERIFERFYRVGSELRRETKGVGIGLSIVRHIVQAHGGKVVVRSAPGEGSTFTIVLPIDSREQPDKR